jgi:hypothetical protein
MTRLHAALFTTATVLLMPCPAIANWVYDPEPPDNPTDNDVHVSPAAGEYRFLHTHVHPFTLDSEGTGGSLADRGEHRLRLAPSLRWKNLLVRLEADILDGQVFGDHENLAPDHPRFDRRNCNHGLDFRRALLREAFVEWRSPAGVLKVGQMTSQFGLGLSANAGLDDDERFGVSRWGDVVDRVMFATTPFRSLSKPGGWGDHLTLFVTGDLVFRDENASLVEGDLALQAVGGVAYRHPDATNGVLVSYRWQKDRDDDRLEVVALDAYGRNRFSLPTRNVKAVLHFDYEVVGIFGHTNRVRDVANPEGLKVRALGAVGRIAWDFPDLGLRVGVEGGYASGDGNPYDEQSSSFFFDPDYRAGLIFHEEMWPLLSARSIEQITDPARAAVPPKGIEGVASCGRVTNSLHAMPSIRWRTPLPGRPGDEIRILAGAAILGNAIPMAQAWYTFNGGGLAHNPYGARTRSRYIGTELLASVQARVQAVPEHLTFRVRLEGGVLLPGRALEDRNGHLPDPVWKMTTMASLDWR